MLESRRALVLYGLLWIGWGILAYLASAKTLLLGDLSTTLWVQSFRSAKMDALMRGVSMLGDSISIIAEVIVIVGVLWFTSRRRHALLILMSPAIIGVGDVLKWIIGRPRPSVAMVAQLTELGSSSFPSGHVVWATTLVVCLLVLVDLKQRLHFRVAFWTVLLAFALLTGLSRIYLGTHWLSDVIGGYSFGVLAALGLCTLYRRWIEPRFLKGRALS